MLFWRGAGSWQGRDPPGGRELGRGERFAPDSFPSWLQWERGEGRGLVAPSSPRGETGTPEAAGMGFTGWESRLVLKQASTRAGERGQLGRGGVHVSLLILFLIMFLSGNGGEYQCE